MTEPSFAAKDRGGLQVRGVRCEGAGPYSLAIAPGGAAAITGPPGSGKTLLLRMIAGLEVHEGRVNLNGQSREALSVPAWRKLAPYVGSEAGWWREQVAEHFAPNRRRIARALAERLGIEATRWEGQVSPLSKSERQRLALVRAIILDPPLLLLDDPTAALDRDCASAVEAVLAEHLRRGSILVLVSNDLEQAKRLGAEPYSIVGGGLERHG